jgi:N6-L-threonylcarbamoyladenine synthase
MIILGVESTAHTFGIGIITDKGEILANAKDSYTSPDSGMKPDDVIKHHQDLAEDILQKALNEANLTWDDIDLMSYSAGPGIDPCLWVGFHKAKEWSDQHKKKLIPVNHCCAHLSIGKLVNQLNDPCYLYVSGVNTQIIVQEKGKYRVMGETLDIGLGNMLDKFGRLCGLGFPAGPKIEQLAKKGQYIELPYIVKGMDASFSGILTKGKQLLEKGAKVEDLCFSIQETCFAMLAEVVERAMAHTEKNELILVGGVGANQRFCEMLDIMCKERGAKFYKVPINLAVDQGVMIAWEGYLRKDNHPQMEVDCHWRADEV